MQPEAMELVQDMRVSAKPAAGFVVVGFYWGAFAAYAPQLKAQAGLGDAAFGLALLFGAAGAVLAMWLAPVVDRWLGARGMALCMAALAAGFLLPGLAGSYAGFAAAMFLATAASGLLDVVMNTRVSELEGQSGRPLMNLNHALFSFAYAASAMMAGLLRGGGTAPAWVFAGIGLLAIGLAVWVRHSPPLQAEQGSQGPKAALPRLLILLAGTIVLIAFMAEQSTEAWSALHLERSLGVGAAAGALGPAVLGLTMGVGRLSGQIIVRRLAEGAVMRWAATVAAVGAVLAAWAPGQMLAYVGFGILGLGVSVVAPMAFAWVGKHVAADLRGRAISRLAVIGYSGFFIGPPIMGFLSEAFGLPMAFTAIALVLLLIPVVLVPAVRRLARPETQADPVQP